MIERESRAVMNCPRQTLISASRCNLAVQPLPDHHVVLGDAVVLSLGCGVPAISLAYRPKCIDFMKSVSLERFACRTDRMDADRLIGLVDEIDAAYDVTSAEIVAACDAVRGRLSAAAAAVMAALATGAGSLAESRPAVEAI